MSTAAHAQWLDIRRTKLKRKLLMTAVRMFAGDVDVSLLYETPTGIKIKNPLVTSEQLSYPFLSNRLWGGIDPTALALGIDGLRDEHTLLDAPVAKSPHFFLMEALANSRPIEGSSYVLRSRDGLLDMRPPREITNAFIHRLRDRFAETMAALDRGASLDVKVVRFGDRLYIADGKHRAACALIRGEKVQCEDVTPVYYDSFFFWLRRKMTERAHLYTKHLRLLDAIAQTPGEPTCRS